MQLSCKAQVARGLAQHELVDLSWSKPRAQGRVEGAADHHNRYGPLAEDHLPVAVSMPATATEAWPACTPDATDVQAPQTAAARDRKRPQGPQLKEEYSLGVAD